MTTVKDIKDNNFLNRFKGDMPDGSLRHGAMLDFSVTEAATKRRHRQVTIEADRKSEESRKISEQVNTLMSELGSDLQKGFSTLTESIITPVAEYMGQEGKKKGKKKKKVADVVEADPPVASFERFTLKHNTVDTCSQCNNALQGHHWTLCYYEHHTVKLNEEYLKFDAAAANGPLPEDKLGTIVAVDIRPGVYDAFKPYQVEYQGKTWWYARKALMLAGVDDIPPDIPEDDNTDDDETQQEARVRSQKTKSAQLQKLRESVGTFSIRS
mmetsp:Transcript_96753/g.141539  ORF Transcript_96753/g.141539 Transcript_96753/m.141539 type:complete len:269 (+) Transcript_96753:52-858(+)